MGVEAFFYCYDEAWFRNRYSEPVTIGMLADHEIITSDGSVDPTYTPYLREIDTVMSGNKQWLNNIAADCIYSRVRGYIPEEIRRRSDELFALLFWDSDTWKSKRPEAIPPPTYHAESSCFVYCAATAAYVVDIAFDLEELRPFFEQGISAWTENDRAAMGLRNLDDFDTFQWWVDAWLSVFKQVVALGKGSPWALMIYVWN